jgi:hypothetical protein
LNIIKANFIGHNLGILILYRGHFFQFARRSEKGIGVLLPKAALFHSHKI